MTRKNSISICNDSNWTNTVDHDQLSFTPKPMGPRHTPIRHSMALDMFRDRLNGQMTVKDECGMLSPDRNKYMYLATVSHATDAVREFGVGFVNFNDRSKAFSPIMGERIFVCSNEMITCSHTENNMMVKFRHSTHAETYLEACINNIFTSFTNFVEGCVNFAGALNAITLSDSDVGTLALEMHRNTHIGKTDIFRIVDEFYEPSFPEFKDPTAMNFFNATTHVFKKYKNPLQKIALTDEARAVIAPQFATF